MEKAAMPTASAQDAATVGPEAEKALDSAKVDLMGRLNVTEEAIVVKSVEAVEWPNTSLGCPQPGMMYLQVITPGFRIVLTANGQDYDYHTTMEQALLCAP
jgi:hypothetical protein